MQQESILTDSLLQNINSITKQNKPQDLVGDNIIQVISSLPSKPAKQKITENEENLNTIQKQLQQQYINTLTLPGDITIMEEQKEKSFIYAFDESDEDFTIEEDQQDKELIYNSLTPSESEIKRAIEIMSVQFKNYYERLEQLYILLKSNRLPIVQNPDQKLSDIQAVFDNEKKVETYNVNQRLKHVDLVSIIPSKKSVEKKAKIQQNVKVDKIQKTQNAKSFFVMKQTPKKQPTFEQIMLRKKDDNQDMKKFVSFNKQKPSKQIDFFQKQLQIIEESFNRNEENIKVFTVKPAQFYTNEQRHRFIQKRMVARAFVKKGYGLNNLRKELQQTPYNYKFDQNRYKTVSYGMATDAFRKLEQFLQQYCKNTIYRLQKLQMRPLYSILLNCRDHFPQQSITFIKFVQIQFNIDCQYMIISRRQATKLYDKIINQYRIKDGDFKFYDIKLNKNDRGAIPMAKVFDYFREQQWSPESDYQLLEFYKAERNVSKVRDKYREHYGPGTQFEDCKIIKSRLNKALRAAIRKVKSAANQARQYSEFVPFLNTLNNDRIKKILISPDAIEARVYLCDVYSCRSISSKLMEQVVIMMEDSIRRIEKKRLEPDYDDYDF